MEWFLSQPDVWQGSLATAVIFADLVAALSGRWRAESADYEPVLAGGRVVSSWLNEAGLGLWMERKISCSVRRTYTALRDPDQSRCDFYQEVSRDGQDQFLASPGARVAFRACRKASRSSSYWS